MKPSHMTDIAANSAISSQAPESPPKAPRCCVCGCTPSVEELVPADIIRPRLARLIKRHHPDWNDTAYVCLADLNRFRMEYVRHVLEAELGELSVLETDVLHSLKEHELVANNVELEFEKQRTLGERLSDLLAAFGGSWGFITVFCGFMAAWIFVNSAGGFRADPYPFILLNLLLSCLAALQAPIIMMSQKRQEARDRLCSQSDYKVNLKAELEIRHLHEKIDHLLRKQSQRLFEIQQIQLELLSDLTGAHTRNANPNGSVKLKPD